MVYDNNIMYLEVYANVVFCMKSRCFFRSVQHPRRRDILLDVRVPWWYKIL